MEQVEFVINPADLQYGLRTTDSKGLSWLLWLLVALAAAMLLLLLLREDDPPQRKSVPEPVT